MAPHASARPFWDLAAGYADCILGTKDSPSIVIDEMRLSHSMFLIPFAWVLLRRLHPVQVLRHTEAWPLKRLQDVPGVRA